MIIYGTKKIERRLGWVADFCPICRRPTACQLIRLSIVSHLYYVSLGQGKAIGMLIECAECGTRVPTEDLVHAGIEKKPPDDLAFLMAKTFPTLPEYYAWRFEIETAIQQDPKGLEPDVRQRMLREPFELLDPLLATRISSATVDFHTGAGCLGTLVIGVATPFLIHFLVPPDSRDDAYIVLMVLLGAGILYTLIQSYLGIGRYVRKFTLPNLARALAPLQPEQTEIQAILGGCKQRKMAMGKYVRGDALWAKLKPGSAPGA